LKNYYEILGVPRDATEAAIRERFRSLAREEHPDLFIEPTRKKAAEERFQLLTEAVNVLTSEARRKAHDFDLEKARPVSENHQAVARVYLAKGVRAYKEGDFREAVAQFDLAVKHWDKDAKAFHYLALACMRVVGQIRRGVEAGEAAVRLDSNNPAYHKDLGKLYMMAGLNAKAERQLEEALSWFPDDEETRRLLDDCRSESTSRRVPNGIFGRKG
jgi:DnaJ-class molecular chaperone